MRTPDTATSGPGRRSPRTWSPPWIGSGGTSRTGRSCNGSSAGSAAADDTTGVIQDPTVGVLMDPTDDVRVTAGLLARHNPSRGRVVVHPTPAPPRDHVLAHDVLAALGRPVNRIDAEHLGPAKRAWAAAAAWMLAERIHDLVVLRADRLPA